MDSQGAVQPVFRAVASSTRPIYQLLKAIAFSGKIHVEISPEGVKFVADNNRVMQGVASISKGLFTSYSYQTPPKQDADMENGDDEPDAADKDEEDANPSFQISLTALLETLQIFGAVDNAARQAKADADPYRSNLRNYRPDAFSNQTLGMPGTCSFSYGQEGDPFSVILEDAGVKTTCNLTTYLPEAPEDIFFDRDDIGFKVITQAKWLLEALTEMAPTNPEKLTLIATRSEPYLRLASSGPLGTSSVDFGKGRDLLDTFSVKDKWVQSYKFDMVKCASEAMRLASKVSLRGDGQGVLSLQFMVETEGGGTHWLHFTFVPLVLGEDESDGDEEEEGDDEL